MIARAWLLAAALALPVAVLPGASKAQQRDPQAISSAASEAVSSSENERRSVADGSETLALLEQMNGALESRAFSGTLVVFRDGRLDAVRIQRFRDAGGWRERITSLSGESAEFERSGDGIRVVAGGEVSTWASGAESAIQLRQRSVPDAHYQLVNYGMDRVAGRAARVIDIRPRDGFRYGYRLWLDVESTLPLKSLTIGADGRPIEQFMFANIELAAGSAAAEDSSGATDARAPAASRLAASAGAELSARWKILDAPAGFAPVVVESGQRTHMLFTDGVARVSVYVEPVAADQPNLSGQLGRGAMHAFGRVAHGQQIIVMGDVPATTVERLAQGLVPSGAATDR